MTSDGERDGVLVRQVLQLVGDLQIEAALELIAEDVTLELPFRGDGGPRLLRGAEARAFIRALPQLFTRLLFEAVVVHGPLPSGVVVAEYVSNGVTSGGHPYSNTYVALFEVRAGRVASWREYFDPTVVSEAFPSVRG